MPQQIDGQRLRALRETKRWDQAQLAEAAGLKPRTVRCIEKSGVASRAALAAIAVALGLEPADLLPGSDGPGSGSHASAQGLPGMVTMALVLGCLAGAGGGYLYALLTQSPPLHAVWLGLVWVAPIVFALLLLWPRPTREERSAGDSQGPSD